MYVKYDPIIQVGDTVVRGPDWEWCNQDGGMGNKGVVIRPVVSTDWWMVTWTGSTTKYAYRMYTDCHDLTVISRNGAATTLDTTIKMGSRDAPWLHSHRTELEATEETEGLSKEEKGYIAEVIKQNPSRRKDFAKSARYIAAHNSCNGIRCYKCVGGYPGVPCMDKKGLVARYALVNILSDYRSLRLPFYKLRLKKEEERKRDEENRKIPLRSIEEGIMIVSCLSVCKDIANKSL